MIDAVLIQQPAVNFAAFLGIANEALGYSPGRKCDASGRKLSDAERFISCLEALRDPQAVPGLYPHLFNHVSFSVLIAADERDLLDVLEVASGMHFVTTETQVRGINLVVVTGTLAQWRGAVISGSRVRGACQACYCKILQLFEQAGLNVWNDCTKKPDGKLFLLEDRRTK
jgi:hypothetical protein